MGSLLTAKMFHRKKNKTKRKQKKDHQYLPPAWNRKATAVGSLRRTNGSFQTSSSENCLDLRPRHHSLGNRGSCRSDDDSKINAISRFEDTHLVPFDKTDGRLFLHRPLVFFQRRSFLHGRVVWDRIGTLLVQVCQDELSHSRVQLPDAGGHHADGESCFVVSSHLLFSLFLHTQREVKACSVCDFVELMKIDGFVK